MSRLLTAFVALSLSALAQPPALSLYAPKAESQPVEVIDAARSELWKVLEPLEMELNWRTVREPDGEPAVLVVIRFAGSCSFSDYNPTRIVKAAGLPLASTAISNGRVLPFVTVECSRLRDRIAAQAIGWRPSERNAALGRAVGRVLAHEIYHVLTGDRKHAREGIASSCLSTRDLLAESFYLDNQSLAQMRPARPEPLVATDEIDPDATGR